MASGNLCSYIKTPLTLNIFQGFYLDEPIYCAGVFPVFDVKFVHVYCLRYNNINNVYCLRYDNINNVYCLRCLLLCVIIPELFGQIGYLGKAAALRLPSNH